MKLSNKEILIIISIFSSIFLVKSVVEAIDRHKQMEIEEQVERERLEIEGKRLEIKRERLEIERRREQREEQKQQQRKHR